MSRPDTERLGELSFCCEHELEDTMFPITQQDLVLVVVLINGVWQPTRLLS